MVEIWNKQVTEHDIGLCFLNMSWRNCLLAISLSYQGYVFDFFFM